MKKEQTALTIRLAEPGDAQPIAEMSRDFIESGLGWRYDQAHILRAMRRRETAVLVAAERQTYVARDRPAVSGFAVMDFGDGTSSSFGGLVGSATVTHAYDAAHRGQRTVSLTVVDTLSRTTLAQTVIIVP